MELQKELKNAKFESVFQQALVNIFFTYHWSNQKVKHLIEPYAITQQQFNVLRILRGQYPNPCTNKLLKSRILDKMCDISRIVDRLVQKGFVNKEVSRTDMRALDVVISEKGLKLLKKLDSEVDFSTIVNSNLTEEDAVQLNLLLDKFRG